MSIEFALFGALLLLIGNAFFVGAEFSMVSVRRSAIEPLATSGSRRALITLRALENISFLMAGAQLGITLCSLGLGAIAEPALAHVLEEPFHAAGVPAGLLHPIAFTIALAITVFAHVVIGEMVPKNIALAKPERAALILTPALVFVVKVLHPVVHALNAIANGFLRLMNIQPKPEVTSTYTRDEMADLVKESRKEGYLSEDNEQLLSGALTFDVRNVHEVVIPTEELIMVDRSATYADVEALSVKTAFSRFPVAGKKGQMVGYVHVKDMIKVAEKNRFEKISKKDIRQLVEVSSTQSIRMTLKIMQRSGAHIAVVKHGKAVAGIVALEDVLEELVGEMRQDS